MAELNNYNCKMNGKAHSHCEMNKTAQEPLSLILMKQN